MRGLHDSTDDEASLILTPPPSPLSLDHQPPAHPSRPPLERQISKNRRYTNVVCCPDMLNAIVSPWTRRPWGGTLLPTLSTVSDPCTPQARLLALLAVPHSAMSVGAAWNRVATSVWCPVVETREWNCGTQCEMWGVVRRLFYIKDVLLLCMTLRLQLSGPWIRTTQRLPPLRSTRTKKQHGQLSTKPR